MSGLFDLFVLGGSASVVASMIFIAALLGYLFWYFPYEKGLTGALSKFEAELEKSDKNFSDIEVLLSGKKSIDDVLNYAWLETKSRVIQTKDNEYIMHGSPTDIWNGRYLLSKRFNLALAESIPNILVGIGLFFTFFFLSLALYEATTALTEASSSQDTENAIKHLLELAGSKFITSLSALCASILWTLFLKLSLNNLTLKCEKILTLLSDKVNINASDETSKYQLHLNEEQRDLIEEILEESREQTGTFKRFETDLAVSLAGAINQAFSPQMQTMTEKLVHAITGLSEKMGTMNQEALQKMMDDFASMLQKTTATEMEQLQKTLSDLTQSLHEAGSSFGTQSNQAAVSIEAAGNSVGSNLMEIGEMFGKQSTEVMHSLGSVGKQLTEHAKDISEALTQGTEQLEKTIRDVVNGFVALDELVDKAADKGKEGIGHSEKLLIKVEQSISQLSEAGDVFTEVSKDLSVTSNAIIDIVENVQELANEQKLVVSAVKETAPNAMEAIEKVSVMLEQAGQQSLVNMQETRQSMEMTAMSLKETLGSITEGVSVYSEQVADLHRKMDEQLARAVGGFSQGVKELMEVVEELTEVMPKV